METPVFERVRAGKLVGVDTPPQMIETVISRVFFLEDDTVLKFYKRDNDWWNTSMRDISQGIPRARFIRQDFELNQCLNPAVYLALKVAVVRNGVVHLDKPDADDDELVIVMKKEDVTGTFTDVLMQGTLAEEDCTHIGRSFIRAKQAVPPSFLPELRMSWYEQNSARLDDTEEWARSEALFSPDLATTAIAFLRTENEARRDVFRALRRDDLSVLIDCNSENLIYTDRSLRFLDAYPPKEEWRIGMQEVDVFRVGADLYAMCGEPYYRAFLEGVRQASVSSIDMKLEKFYLIYAAMIAGPYFFMLSRRDEKYCAVAEKYVSFIDHLLSSYAS